MTFLQLAQQRHSVRDFLPTPIEREKIEYVLDCARLAPSAVNFQPWKFVVVESEKAREALRPCYARDWFRTAPLYIVVCADAEAAWKRPEDGKNHADVDAAIATEHLCLAAAEIGLGTCWVCRFDPQAVASALDIRQPLYPVAIVPLGYPAPEVPKAKLRKDLQDITAYV